MTSNFNAVIEIDAEEKTNAMQLDIEALKTKVGV